MRRVFLVCVVGVLVLTAAMTSVAPRPAVAGHAHAAPVKKKCTIKKVHGKKTKVCKTVKPKPTPRPTCPNPEGDACLGTLHAGTYHTVVFDPKITYTVPDGWANYEDLPGNFLLVPPGFTLDGVNAGTSDYIGIYTNVAAPNTGCNPGLAPGIDETVSGISQWIVANPGLVATQPRSVSIGGLQGVVLDVRMVKTWQGTCPWTNGVPAVALITGVPPSGLDHGLIPGLVIRLYLLKGPLGTLAIEVDDVQDAGHLDAYSKIVESVHFTS